jgi:hypothetical protein
MQHICNNQGVLIPMSDDTTITTGDLLLGGLAVTSYVNTLLDAQTQITPGQLYAWVERGHLPVARIGNRIVGSKERIAAALSGK